MQKRLFDFILALFGIIFSFPLWILIAGAVLLEDGRPVFFLQERVGKDGKIFKIIKFRTMRYTNKPYADIDLLGLDFRVTKIGRILRATAMDELPQLVNILKGEMSFVGPKPLPYVIEDEEQSRYKYLNEVPGYATRIKIRPGLTGLAQIYASKTVIRRNKFRYDNLYVKKHHLFLDIKLIFYSFLISFMGKWEKEKSKI